MKLIFTLVLWLISASAFARHYVLVAGLNNEFVSAYFQSFETHLKSRGENHISKVMPSSQLTVTENNLKLSFLNLYKKYNEPLVIFAHSKGSIETAHTLALSPENFPAGIVEKIVYVNSPFKGSPYTPESIRELSLNPLMWNAVRVQRSLLAENLLTLKLSDESLSDRTYFVRTQQEANKVSVILRKSAAFLKVPNDGLIPVNNQLIDNFGHDLGIFSGIDHTDFFVRRWSSDSTEARALDEILEAIHN